MQGGEEGTKNDQDKEGLLSYNPSGTDTKCISVECHTHEQHEQNLLQSQGGIYFCTDTSILMELNREQ